MTIDSLEFTLSASQVLFLAVAIYCTYKVSIYLINLKKNEKSQSNHNNGHHHGPPFSKLMQHGKTAYRQRIRR